MSVSRTDSFAVDHVTDASGAIPVSDHDGRPHAGYRLPVATRLGPVELQVSNLSRSLAYYRDVIGLAVVAVDSTIAVLGVHGDRTPLVVLRAMPGTRAIAPGSRLGLYHFAILLPDRAALGRFITHLAALGVRAGSSDHLVSEALYLQDPDGLGIEVYADRPRSTWRHADGELLMASDPLDVADLVRAANGVPWTGVPTGTVIGHVHLHVGELAAAGAFYAEGVGFDRMVSRYPGALFLGAGGYHHHLGTNTWARGATVPDAHDAKLLTWTILLPSDRDVAELRTHLTSRAVAVTDGPDGLALTDPWGTPVRVTVGVSA